MAMLGIFWKGETVGQDNIPDRNLLKASNKR